MRPSRVSLIVVTLIALAMSGCMRASAPPAVAPRADLDALIYKTASCTAERCAPVVVPANAAIPANVANAYAATEGPYRLDAGDKLRIVVFGQEGLTNTYAVDAGGSITMPLIGGVRAKGLSPAELAGVITARLKHGYIREPYVAVEIEAYRPFFILGEVTAPVQYPYVPNMTAESAVAIAGGFTPRAQRQDVKLTRTYPAGPVTTTVPLATTLKPGDTILVGERWF
ncbi:MAG: polysaccharide export protein [Afipia sp.]|nr:polysaccharide export protein [Afipia sp.]